MSRAIVVGGGIAGLTSALRLQQQGIDVVVLEKSSRAGGVLGSTHVDGFLLEHAASGFLGGCDRGALELCDELDVELCEAPATTQKRWILLHDELHELPASPVAFARSGLLSWRGKLAAMGAPLRGVGRQGLDETVGSFARRRFGDEVAEHIIAPFVTGIFAGDADALSLKAVFPDLAKLDANGGMVRGMVERRLRARTDRGRRSSRLSAPREGVGALTRAIARRLGDAIELGVEVVGVETRSGQTRVVLANGELRDADAVVLATPAHAAASLVEGTSPALAKVCRTIPYAPAVVVHLGFDRASIEHSLDGFGFLVAAGGRQRILGCVFESVLWPGRAPDGKVLLRCILGGTRDPSACEGSDQELIRAAGADLEGALGLRGEPVCAHVTRWPAAIAQYTVGHTDRVARAEALAGPLGVVLAGSGYHGVAVNSCVSSAANVVRAVLARSSAAVAAALLLVALVACSGGGNGGKSVEGGVQRDGGDAAVAASAEPATARKTPEGAAPPYLVGDVDAKGRLIDAGKLQVQVSWSDPPAGFLRSPGANSCGATRAPAVSVHTLHGLRGAVVEIQGIARGVAPAGETTSVLSVRDCAIQPRVRVLSRFGAPLAITSDDDRRHEITIEKADDGSPVARVPLPLVGQRYELSLDEPGHYRVTGESVDDVAWVVSPGHPYVAVTDEKGRVAFPEVPAGTYRVVAWHPPVRDGQEPISATGEVVVKAGETAELTLAPRPL